MFCHKIHDSFVQYHPISFLRIPREDRAFRQVLSCINISVVVEIPGSKRGKAKGHEAEKRKYVGDSTSSHYL